MIHFYSDHYKISFVNPTRAEEEITIFSNDGEYGVSVQKSVGAPPTTYTIYPPNEQRNFWKVVPLMDQGNPKSVCDSNSLWSVLPLEQRSKKIYLLKVGAFLATVASVALLACKLLGWITVGHWGLYLAVAAISMIAINYLSKNQDVAQFDIANRIYSVLELANNNVQKIDAQSKLLLNPSS